MSNRRQESAAEAPDTVRSLRARLGITQAEWAKRSRLGLTTIIDIEAGRSVRLESIQQAAAGLGVETSVLVAAMEREVVVRKVSAFHPRRPAQTCRPPRETGGVA